MSQEHFVDFCRHMSSDEELAGQIEQLQAASDVVALADGLGFVFTELEMQLSSRALAERTDQELSEFELTQLSGGCAGPSAGLLQAGASVFRLGRKQRWW
jgi:predicted ribosomally synthesized peptide with nif11-like leader